MTLEALTSSGRRALLRLNNAPDRETVRNLRLVINESAEALGMVIVSAVAGAVRAEAMAYAAPGKTTHIELTFQRDARIASKVLEPKGRYRVHAWHVRGPGIGGHPIETESLSDGSFELAVTPGTWQVSVAPSRATSTYLQAKTVTVTVMAGEEISIELEVPAVNDDAGVDPHFFSGIADGIAFDSENGFVKVGFLASACRACKTGLRTGDLVLSINGAPIGTTLEAFAEARAAPAEYLVRRQGAERRFRVAEQPHKGPSQLPNHKSKIKSSLSRSEQTTTPYRTRPAVQGVNASARTAGAGKCAATVIVCAELPRKGCFGTPWEWRKVSCRLFDLPMS